MLENRKKVKCESAFAVHAEAQSDLRPGNWGGHKAHRTGKSAISQEVTSF